MDECEMQPKKDVFDVCFKQRCIEGRSVLRSQ